MAENHVCTLGPQPEEQPVGAQESTFGLTPAEKQLITESWNLVKQDLAGNGIHVLLTFFKDYPHNLQYFPFKDVPVEKLAGEPALKAHGIRVLRDLTASVDNINKPKTVLHALHQNALNHRKRHIPKDSYDELRLSILKALGAALGEEIFNAEAERIWDKALIVILGAITDAQTGCICGQ